MTYGAAPDVTADDALVIPLLKAWDIELIPAVWDDPAVRWDQFDAIIFRSCWDYHLKEKEFRRWLNDCRSARWNVWNPVDVLSWNMTKHYLEGLAGQGIRIPQTVWLEPGAPVDLPELLRTNGWNRAVIKPDVSATAYHTWMVDRIAGRECQKRLDEILKFGWAIVQEYLPEVADGGEWSFLFFHKQFSHAVIKRPRTGDFRVQRQFGGTAAVQTPPPELVHHAGAIVQTIEAPLLYARVDGIDRNGTFILLELELIEPVLFLRADPSAPAKFARAIEMILNDPKRSEE